MHTIAPALPADAPAMLAIQKRAFAEEGRRCEPLDIPPLVETLAAIVDHVRHHTALVARDGPRIVGSVRGLVEGSVCTVRGLGVDPDCQGRGIGSALLQALEASLPQVSCFRLTTNTLIAGNVRFYERHGYEVREWTHESENIVLAQMSKLREAAPR